MENLKKELTDAVHFLYQKGYAPATSSNYSFRVSEADSDFYISESGVDKAIFAPEHLIHVTADGAPIADTRRTSAETLLHCLIYKNAPKAKCILHTHSIYNTILSKKYKNAVNIKDYELLKAIENITTHKADFTIPIFANSQNMIALSADIDTYWQTKQPTMQAFLLSAHGLYTWAESIAAAKRQIEAIEFLLECEYKLPILA